MCHFHKKFNRVIELINETFDYNGEYGLKWVKMFYDILEKTQLNINAPDLQGKIYCYVRTGRNIKKKLASGEFSHFPFTSQTDGAQAKKVAIETACLMLLKQNGRKEDGWNDAEFWWPVLVPPKNRRPVVYAR